MSALPKCTCLFRCLLSLGKKTSSHAVAGKTQSSNKAFLFRWIPTENPSHPAGQEVEAFGRKWQQGIRQKVLSITEGQSGV
jgi:hypothetical protein